MSTSHGIEVPDLPDGYTPLEVVYTVKCLDEDGALALVNGASDGLNTWEAMGMATSLADDLRDALRR